MPYAITATKRTALGRQAKTTLVSGQVPAVVYGHGLEPRPIQIARGDFRKLYRAAGTSSLIDLTIEGEASVKALIQEVQVHPTLMEPAHVDFHQIRMDEKVTVEVPLRIVGESRAVKELAGTLMVSMDEIEVQCLPGDLPHEIVVDISTIESFDQHITIDSLPVLPGVKFLKDGTLVVASVSRPLTEDELKKLEASDVADVTAIKTEAEEKKAAEAAKKAEEEAAEKSSK